MKTTYKSFEVIGTLEEMNIQLVDTTRKVNGSDVKTRQYAKNDFTKPSILVQVNDVSVPLHYKWGISEVNADGTVGNTRFSAMETIVNEYIPMSKATEEKPASRVKVTGVLEVNEYVNKDDEWASSFRLNIINLNRIHSTEDKCDIVVDSAFISKITDEVYNDTETGRLIYEVLAVEEDWQTKQNVIVPFTIYADKEVDDGDGGKIDISDFYSVGDTARLYLTFNLRHVGGKTTVSGGRGFGKTATISSGYDVAELFLVGGEEQLDEDDENAYKKEAMRELLKIRHAMIDTKIEEKKNAPSQSRPVVTTPKKSFGKAVEVNEEDIPF